MDEIDVTKRLPKPNGRPKGSRNKTQGYVREAIGHLLHRNMYKLERLLTRIGEEDGPRAEWDCIMGLLEYNIPKLQRQEVVVERDEETPAIDLDEITRRTAYLLANEMRRKQSEQATDVVPIESTTH